MFEAIANPFGLTDEGAAAANHALKQLSKLGITPSKELRACVVFPMDGILVALEPESRRLCMWHRNGVLDLLVLPGGIAPQDAETIQDYIRKMKESVEPAAPKA